MKVELLRDGYYNHRRVYKGETLFLEKPEDFSEKWMKSHEAKQAPAPEVVQAQDPVAEDSADDEVI